MRKKIFVFIDWFHPGYKAGGPIQSCVNFAYGMQKDFDVYIFTSDTDFGESEPYSGIVQDRWINFDHTDFKVFYASKAQLSFRNIQKLVQSISPDFIYLNSMYSVKFVLFPLWFKYFKRMEAKVILCPRGALYDSALSIKRFKKMAFIKLFGLLSLHKMITFQATNGQEKRAIEKYFGGCEIKVIDDFMATNQQSLQSYHKIAGNLKCVYIARISPIKNLLFLLKAISRCHTQIQITIVGPIEDPAYWKACEDCIANMPGNITIDFVGPVPNAELRKILITHHLYCLPTEGESFGHSIFEAFLAGRPVLISDQSPWRQLQENQVGWDIPLTAPELFTSALESAANWSQATFDEFSSKAWAYAKGYIEQSDVLEQYRRLFL